MYVRAIIFLIKPFEYLSNKWKNLVIKGEKEMNVLFILTYLHTSVHTYLIDLRIWILLLKRVDFNRDSFQLIKHLPPTDM